MFPISNLINVVARARGHRHDEIPRSYQIVLFTAGLRGAVGVALAEGMKGAHAVALRTTVLVSVVLSVVVFGSSVQQVIEAVGIQTGVVDDDDDSDSDDEEERYYAAVDQHHQYSHARSPSTFALGTPGASHHLASNGYRTDPAPTRTRDVTAATPVVEPSSSSLPFTPRLHRPQFGGGGGGGGGGSPGRRRSSFSPASNSPHSSSDSDTEVLPSAADPASGVASSSSSSSLAMGAGGVSQVWSTLDEQFLLPVFSNATANRHSSRQKASAKAKRASLRDDRPGEGGDGGRN